MNKQLKKALLWTGSVFAFLIVVLAVHIYMVTRPKAPDEHTRAMARIDIRQPITEADADKITTWLYARKGVDHVLVNSSSNIVVFTFFPIRTSADRIVHDFTASLGYKAERFVPTEAGLKGGCPVASTSLTYKMYNFVKQIF